MVIQVQILGRKEKKFVTITLENKKKEEKKSLPTSKFDYVW